MDDRVHSTATPTVLQSSATPLPGLSDTELRRTTDFLLDNDRIGNHRTRYEKYRRYAPLNLQQMYNSLCSLYESLIRSRWSDFKRMAEIFAPHGTPNIPMLITRVYISHWIHDLYCANREATKAISPLAFNERFSHERMPYSYEYDPYLALLMASIKPTHIQLTTEDTLYIPTFGDNLDWNEADHFNPFALENFSINHDIFYGVISVLRDRKEWKIVKTSTNFIGRACWLFDWHTNTQVCAWFPRERNYNDTDVSLAYIIGVACTPKLGHVDVDAWQTPSPSALPNFQIIEDLPRVDARRFYGSYEVRTIETEQNHILSESVCEYLEATFDVPLTQKRKKSKGKGTASGGTGKLITTEPSGNTEQGNAENQVILPPIPRFRILDWVYMSRVILTMEWHTRTGALRTLILA